MNFMGNNIQKHDFENAKNALKEFSKKIPSSPNLPIVETHGLFDLFQREVTGAELNKVTNEIQKCLIAANQQQIRVIKEFEQIYQTFEALDKDYIQGLTVGMKAAEAASLQAAQAATEAYKVAEEAKKHASDIESLIKTQSIFIDKLVEFKERIENIPNIDKVSTMCEDIENFQIKVEIIQNRNRKNEAEIIDRFAAQNALLLQKIKIAYAVAGAFGAITVTHAVLAMLGIA